MSCKSLVGDVNAQQLPFIPEFITVHLGLPKEAAENLVVSFPDYIKNVASSEIYPTWPESAIYANLYAQVSYSLNRVYTEFYRSMGYDFDITSSTQHDQKYIKGREIFENISQIVDDIFNNYVVRRGRVEPLFASYCNGTTSTCSGLSQWGTVDLANQGLGAYEILQHYYGDDIDIIENAPISENVESYRGFPMKLGAGGNEVFILQGQLNRIGGNYPALPKITDNLGLYDMQTENAVRTFQGIFNLDQDGIVGKATWYKVKYVYNGIKKLSDLASEGLTWDEVEIPFPAVFQEGDVSEYLKPVQYHVNVINYFYPDVPRVEIDGIYGPVMKAAIIAIQNLYGLMPDGILEKETWVVIERIYEDILKSLPQGYEKDKAVLFPNYYLSEGMADQNVTYLQTYLSRLAGGDSQLLPVEVTGVFDPQTTAAVKVFQRKYGLEETGIVGPLTWRQIALLYNAL